MNGLMMDYPLKVDRILEHGNRLYPGKRVLTPLPDGTVHEYTYADLYRRVKRLAKALVKLGVDPGDRIATFSWNNYQHLELYYAIPGAAAICHTLNIRLFAEQLVYIVNHARDKVLFIDGSLLPIHEAISPQIESVEHHIVFNGTDDLNTSLPNAQLCEEFIAGSDDDFEWIGQDENMAAGLCYTSGTKASQGRPVFGVEARIVDDAGAQLAWDGAGMGELQVRGPAVIRQYFKHDVSMEHFTQDGWFRTGDVVTISPDGYLRIADRTKDLVRSGGEWISTVELENAIMAHPQVLEAAVIAVPDPKWQERPLALVVPTTEGDALTSSDITTFLLDKVAKWWIPDAAIFVQEIPKTSVGKFDKKKLRERFANGDSTS